MFGIVTLKSVTKGEQPRSNAASKMFGSILFILGSIVRTTYGMLIVIWDIKTVKKPNSPLTIFNINFKISIKDIPVITSELIIGI